MGSSDFALLALQLAAMLSAAGLFAHICRRLGQPPVVGEMLAGIVLGPTLFGYFFPALYERLFYSSANVALAREALVKLGMLFFLFVAGLEIDLSSLRRLGRRIGCIGIVGTFLPIAIGIGLVYLVPEIFAFGAVKVSLFPLALFVGMNLANSANPVIARILMDLGLLHTEIGTVVMTTTIVDDLVNWSLFAIILRSMSFPGSDGSGFLSSIVLVVAFFAVVLVAGRLFGAQALQWIHQRAAWPTGLIVITTIVILIAASVGEMMGLHAFLGAFLAGAALGTGDSQENEAHKTVSNFALSFFAPLYFVSMGLNVNFVRHFDPLLVSVVLVAAFVTKIGSVMLGARMAGMKWNRESWAIAFGLNARGATGMILAGIGLQSGLIPEPLFVALTIMCMVTSLASGPAIRHLVQTEEPVRAKTTVAGSTEPA